MSKEIYNEELSSTRTEFLFIFFTILFLSFSIWHWLKTALSIWTILSIIFFVFFSFYSLNYRTLKICIPPNTLQLTFGIFIWKIAISNLGSCYLDENSIWRFGGAGIHFMWIKGKYRAFFNFLEYPRVVITLKKKKGLVREIAFSTRHSEHVMGTIQSGLS